MNQQLFFNILTFDWPAEPVTFYFAEQDPGFGTKLHSSLFPKQLRKIFPNLCEGNDCFVYTTFNRKNEGFTPLAIDFRTDNTDLIKRFYNREINWYFTKVINKRVKVNFIKENQIWIYQKQESTDDFAVFDKFTLKVQLAEVSQDMELVISFDGQSRISKKSASEHMRSLNPRLFNLIFYKDKFINWADTPKIVDFNSLNAYPVFNNDLEFALGFDFEARKPKNKYKEYLAKLQYFCGSFILREEFYKFIPINSEYFHEVTADRIGECPSGSNRLRFGNKTFAVDTKIALKTLAPFRNSIYSDIHLFFIYHKDHVHYRDLLLNQFRDGVGNFKGLKHYVNVDFYEDKDADIIVNDKINPFDEIERVVDNRIWDSAIKYIAIYITPISKSVKDRKLKGIYFKVKELLLRNKIVSQVIDPEKIKESGANWKFSLPNIAVAMLAKLDGIPWTLATERKNELIVGIGAHKHIEEGVQYIGSAFSFCSTGKFNNFEYFLKSQLGLLAGSIADKVTEYAAIHGKPDRIVIHFFKTMNKDEVDAILAQLSKLGNSYTLIILSINKTEAKDIVAFSNDASDRMPPGGTFVLIGENRYLLYNNNFRPNEPYSVHDGFPFPVKIKIQSTDPKALESYTDVTLLIKQVYEFSRLYYKSVSQQNLPVTIKYPEMVAAMAPYFISKKVPDFGKDKLWFL